MIGIFTDGSCKGNQYDKNSGGYGVVIIDNSQKQTFSQGYKDTTNNRMELRAVICALSHTTKGSAITLHTDSKNVCDAFNENWIEKWKRFGWRTNRKKPVKNQDLWRKLIPLAEERDINWRWVKGHNGLPENEEADELANRAALSSDLLIDDRS